MCLDVRIAFYFFKMKAQQLTPLAQDFTDLLKDLTRTFRGVLLHLDCGTLLWFYGRDDYIILASWCFLRGQGPAPHAGRQHRTESAQPSLPKSVTDIWFL